MRLCHRSRDQLRLRRGCQQLGTFWWTTRPGLGTTGIGDTCDLSDGDVLIGRYDYLCDGMTLQMRNVWSDPPERVFFATSTSREGFPRPQHAEAAEQLHGGGFAGMGRCSRGCIHHANEPGHTAPYNTTPVREWGGDQSRDEDDVTGLARSRRHGGDVGWVDAASAASISRAWRVSRRPTTWVGPGGWEEGDVSGWAEGQTTRW